MKKHCKLNINTIKKLFKQELSGIEIRLFIYLLLRQDKQGIIEGIYYKYVCLDLCITKPSFYNALYKLNDKGLINIECNYKYWRIIIIDNYYLNKKNKYQYININRKILLKKDLSPVSFRMVLYLLTQKRFNEGKVFNIYIDTLKERLNIKDDKTIIKYLNKMVEEEILIDYKLTKGRKLKLTSDVYIITDKERVDDSYYFNHIITYRCSQYNISYTTKTINDLIVLLKQYKFCNKLKLIINDLLLNNKIVQPRLINYSFNN